MKDMQHWCTYCLILFSFIFCSAAFSQPLMTLNIVWYLPEASRGFQLAVTNRAIQSIHECIQLKSARWRLVLVRASPSFPLWVSISLGGWNPIASSPNTYVRRIRLSRVRVERSSESCWQCCAEVVPRSSLVGQFLIYCLMRSSSFHHFIHVLFIVQPVPERAHTFLEPS